ncbi:MAG: SIMPL domain-containing protein [Candidatus Falkowbacteria bacterium]|nr:SIMPL domain-containing protein [Candidatus Falkowbacteria bacterium]
MENEKESCCDANENGNGDKGCCNDKKCCSHGGGHGHKCHGSLLIIGLVLLTAIIITAILRDRIVNQQFKSVTITGQGKVTYTPDLAIVNLGVQIDKVAKPEDALNQLNTKVASIMTAVKAVGVAPEDIQTQNYTLYPQYDYKDNVSSVSGYNANEQLVIKVSGYDKDQNKLSQVIAAASKAGANQVNNLSFDASNMNELKQEARLKAIADAKAKSTALADSAGVHLQDITGWYENMVSPMSFYNTADYGKGGMGAGGTVAPQTPAGDREVIMEIGVTYNIK